ncbi:hypothetical protein SOP89_08730 [Pseudomonas siliginis]|uniref:hypothetical protein n=1 Tax=Pseudomonas siliginis TaxID=2842346 RepID=UPI002B24D448|nr:hypothetical protein [Pseudomonas siliginis]MEB2651458.1 hypothetical protein [Pseudomonas siliginis]
MQEETIELYRQLRASQDKYAYFLLAAVGASIAFALNQTQGLSLKSSQIPLAISILLWGFSFFFGCRHLQYVSSTLYANIEMLKIESGRHPKVGNHPQALAAASEGVRSAIESNSETSNNLAKLQFSLLIAGVVFYISWHTLEMWLRTNA